MKKFFRQQLMLAIFLLQYQLFSQETSIIQTIAPAPALTRMDSVWHSRLPKFTLADLKNLTPETVLPWHLNNAALPYFPPIFLQSGASCGQASGVAFTFTYEINRARDLPANNPDNQYPTHFAYNFANGGFGWYGVSYFHSFEILRTNGTPNITDYGGMCYGGDSRWMTGYDKYFNGMHNRIEQAYTIEVGTPEGLLTLKHWLHNHLDGSAIGGVASFYANAPWNMKTLPAVSHEAGKKVIVHWDGEPTHAMVVVGYNDSIRYDFNNDGMFTNDIDINNDNATDMRDWEIGGLLFANSYGTSWGDDGFCYMLYRTLAEHVTTGGIWNHAVHVVRTLPDYSPMLTAKITISHKARGRIKVTAGVSDYPEHIYPKHTIEYPIFNFQGSDIFMQGGTIPGQETIEFGLDLTPLLNYIRPGEPSKFFLQVAEHDPENRFHGQVVGFSVIDYTGTTPVEHIFPDTHIPLLNNSTTTLGIAAAVNFQPVTIETRWLPPYTSGQPYQVQVEASGGAAPYRWDVVHQHIEHSISFDPLNLATEQVLPLPGLETHTTIPIGFSFPFYDTVYDHISIYPNGFMMFGNEPFPYPYWLDPLVFLKNFRVIGVMMSPDINLIAANSDAVFVDRQSSHLTVKWKATFVWGSYQLPLSFGAVLHSDGRIEFHYSPMDFGRYCRWLAGISLGDGFNFSTFSRSGVQRFPVEEAVAFALTEIPESLKISSNGLLTIGSDDLNQIVDITARATDSRGISGSRTMQLTEGLVVSFFPNPLNPMAGQESVIELFLHNVSASATGLIQLCFSSSGSPNVGWIDPCINLPSLPSGDSIRVLDAARFQLSNNTPCGWLIPLKSVVTFGEKQIEKTSHFVSGRKMLSIANMEISDLTNNKVNPGQNYYVEITMVNNGIIAVDDINVRLQSIHPFVVLLPPVSHSIGTLGAQQSLTIQLPILIHPRAMIGSLLQLEALLVSNNETITRKSLNLVVVRPRILALDLDNAHISIPLLVKALNELGHEYEIGTAINPGMNDYDVVFIGLGMHPHTYVLTATDQTLIRNYLLQGGNLYLEGSSVWRSAPYVSNDLFGVQGLNNGWPLGIDSLSGQPGTFTEGLTFNHAESTLKRIDNMQPLNSAFAIFSDVPTGLTYSVANQTDTYRTIGSSFRYSGLHQNLVDTLPRNLLKKYLDFFGLETGLIAANFHADRYEITHGQSVQFYTKSAGAVQNWRWEFEGGSPSWSIQQNPEVRYDEPGEYAVQLIVQAGTLTDTLLLEDYIRVESGPGINENNSRLFSVFPNPANDYIHVVPQGSISGKAQFSLWSITGKKMVFHETDFDSNNRPVVLSLKGIPRGIYLLKIRSATLQYATRIIVTR